MDNNAPNSQTKPLKTLVGSPARHQPGRNLPPMAIQVLQIDSQRCEHNSQRGEVVPVGSLLLGERNLRLLLPPQATLSNP